MRYARRPRLGRFLHVVLGMVVGAAVMAVMAGLIAAANFELVRAEHEREAKELRRQVEELQRQAEQLRLEVELAEARREAERIRADIELRDRRIRDLERAAGPCVTGRVRLVAGELVVVDAGSDLGLGMEHSVRVYRTPLMQEYLGTLQLLQVEADRAQGLFVPAHSGDQLRFGDIIVAAKPRR
jgi:hypothetical protein